MSETELSRKIQDALLAIGVPCIRIQSGQISIGSRRIHMAPKGTPDLRTPYGWLEVKDPTRESTAKQRANLLRSPKQVAFAETWTRHGDRVAVVMSVEEALRTVRAWQKQTQAFMEKLTHG